MSADTTTSTCVELADQLAASGGDTGALDRAARRHVQGCLRCQADLVQHRRILRTLRAMRAELLEPAPGLLADVLAALESGHGGQAARIAVSGRRRVAYIGGIAAATAAGAAGALVVASRNRRAS